MSSDTNYEFTVTEKETGYIYGYFTTPGTATIMIHGLMDIYGTTEDHYEVEQVTKEPSSLEEWAHDFEEHLKKKYGSDD